MKIKMRMPDIATTVSEVTIVQWLVEIDRPVERGEPLLVVETDKASVELESVAGGVLKEIVAQAGETVETGRIIAVIESDGSAFPSMVGAPEQSTALNPTSPPETKSPENKPQVRRPPSRRKPEPLFARNRRRTAETGETEQTSAPSDASAEAPPSSLPDESKSERDFLLELYERMVLIRSFEDGVKFLFLEGSMPGTIHQCQGQEATAVGVCAALGQDDYITSTFRGHGHALARGLSPEEILIELFGGGSGCCKGKGGSMHIGNIDKRMIPAIAIVGGSIPLAAGMGLAYKMNETGQIVACFFGDGATSEGAFYEGVNLAAIWDAPVIFVCENNLYGASTKLDLVTRVPRIADRAATFGIRGETIDGNDVLAVYEATKRAAEECRSGEGPVLLELLTYRRTGHSRRDPCHYQPEEEKEKWFQRDPIDRLGEALLSRSDVSESDLDAIRSRVEKQYEGALDFARREPTPSEDDVTTDVFATQLHSTVIQESASAIARPAPSVKRMTIAESLREGIAEEMERDPAVFCLGEDIAIPGGFGGAFTVTLGLEEKFPDRMLNTPIAELGFFGATIGAAMMGMRPIVDVQYGDFLFLAMDQIVNNAAKMRYMSGGTVKVPMVIRAPIGATGRGSQHAQSMERYFTGVPGLKVVAVSNAYDAKGILKSAIRDDDPVLIFEHKLLYGSKGARAESGTFDASSDVPSDDYTVPIDRAAVCREGSQVTILSWLLMHHFSMTAAEELTAMKIDAEVIDVRSLSPFDYETIGDSVRKTGHVVIVEEGPKTGGVSAELAAGITERFGDYLMAPVRRVASPDVPVPFAPVLENAYRPDTVRIVEACREIF